MSDLRPSHPFIHLVHLEHVLVDKFFNDIILLESLKMFVDNDYVIKLGEKLEKKLIERGVGPAAISRYIKAMH